MRRRFFKGFSAEVDLKDEQYVKNEKERLVPFSVNPFRLPQSNLPGAAAEKDAESERPPEWLELAGDLAWTATFSSLTSNTTVTEPGAVWNYAVFFGLTWHLWATQTTYDIKYYTNDWWHRVLFASQLGVYALLASFSGAFNVGWKVHPESLDLFVGNTTRLTVDAMVDNQEISIEKSFRGINLMLFISRMFLLLQYLRVLWYRYRSRRFWSWRFILTPLATLGAGGTFLGCFIMMKNVAGHGTRMVAITQLSLWCVAIVIQIIASAFTPEDGNLTLKNEGAIAPRLSTLTVIIIGFRIKYAPSKFLEEVWLWLHFPLHLSLILMLEGIKNLFIYVNVLDAIDLLTAGFQYVETYFDSAYTFPDHPRLEKLLLVLDMSWEQEVKDIWTAAQGNTANNSDASTAQMWRWWGTVTYNTILLYNDAPDKEGDYYYSSFIGSNDTVVANDMNSGGHLFMKFTERYYDLMAYSAEWVITVSGTLLVCMAILNVMQRRPRNRFAWGYSTSRTVIGLLLIIVGGATSNIVLKNWFGWIIPIMCIGYGVAVLVDLVLLRLSVRSIRKKEDSSRGNIAYSNVSMTDFDLSPGMDSAALQHPNSALLYGPAQSVQSLSSTISPSMYIQGSTGSTAHLYAAPIAGAMYSSTPQVTDPFANGQYSSAATDNLSYAAPIAGAMYSSTPQATDPSASGQYSSVPTAYPSP
ncbi:hypothetical protein FRC05_006953 [Tulasnella sp. 425]|nr:hypothetical protein FRC05_006953 [Tulasnella sp. 425]